MSKADSLTVNLDQDIASLGDLEEKQSPSNPNDTSGKYIFSLLIVFLSSFREKFLQPLNIIPFIELK